LASDLQDLRGKLLSVNGIGPETADSIILYAAGKPTFVVDAYTKRIFSRHGLISASATYDETKKFFTDNLPQNTKLFNEYHALIVELGKSVCKTKPECGICPIKCKKTAYSVKF
jgi:endonuclease-3 related protein